MIYKFKNITPKIGENSFIANSAVVIGDVELGDNVSIWFGAVLRGDQNKITIGCNTNVQDNCILHLDEENPLVIGNNVTIGHGAIVHGCTICDNVLIGMGSTILDGSFIPKNCIVGAGAVVTHSLKAEEGSLILGSPAKVVKELSEEQYGYIEDSVREYVDKIKYYNNNLEKVNF